MKNNSTTVKLPKSNRSLLRPDAIVKQDEANRRELKKIAKVWYYEQSGGRTGWGVGYLNLGSPGQRLVEYSYTAGGKLSMKELSLSESSTWMEKALFMEIRMDDAAGRDDDAFAQWLRDVAAATAAT
jgi:hypothetical protein